MYRIRRREPDSGVSSMEWAMLTPLLLGVIFLVVQFALVYYAREVALGAAQSGARVARTDLSSHWQKDAQDQATATAGQLGGGLVSGLTPVASGDLTPVAGGGMATNNRWVDVTGTAMMLIPFVKISVHERAGGPIECFRPDRNGGINCK
jgi:Flp pilus assembly protein TadG